MWKVYKRTCPNGRVYIGITSRTLEERMGAGYQNNLQFALAIQQYGKENIISEVLEECETYDEAIIRELDYIRQYQSICYNKMGATTKTPAQSRLHSRPCTEHRPQRKLHSVPLTTKPRGMHICPISVYDLDGNYITTYRSAKVASEETGVNHGDIISCCKGSKSSGVHRYGCRGYIFRYAVDKLDEFPSKPVACKKVNQYTLSGEYIRTFDSLKDAWLHTGATIGAIGKVCKGLLKSSGGYLWRYAEQDKKEVG